MNKQSNPFVVQPGIGKDLRAFGSVVSVMLTGEQTGGAFAVMCETTPPGGGPPLHVHGHEDELFLVVEGRISYFVEDRWTEVGVGGAVYLPRGIVHCFRNVGTTPSRHWMLTTPAGFEKFFARCAEEFAKAGGPNADQIVKISWEHGIEYVEEGRH